MNLDIPGLFAEITANLEDLHAVSVERQCRDNSGDVQLILAGELRRGLSKVGGITLQIVEGLGGDD